MSDAKRVVTVSSILMIIAGILLIIVGMFLWITMGVNEAAYHQEIMGNAAISQAIVDYYAGITGIAYIGAMVIIANGILDIVVAIFGFRAAGNAAKAGTFVALAGVAFIFSALDLGFIMINMFSSNVGIDWTTWVPALCGVVFTAVALWGGLKIKSDYQLGTK